MITTQSLWGLTGALTLMLIIAIALAYRAYGIGQRAASDASARQIDTLRKNLRAAQQQRDSINTQLEDNKRNTATTIQHMTEAHIRDGRRNAETISELLSIRESYRQELDAAQASNQKLQETVAAERARADSLATTSISPGEVRLVREMSEKLQLAAAAMHATQQFKAAREAKELAQRGTRLAARLDGQHQEAAA